MNDNSSGYAVFFFPPALEVLGDAIKPHLKDGPAGPHVLCREIDTGGAFLEMTIDGVDGDGQPIALEVMVPGNMVRLVISASSEEAFGFGARMARAAPTKPPAAAVPAAGAPLQADVAAPIDTPPKP